MHVRALYAGVSGPLVSVGLVQSINFAIYDSVRRILHQRKAQGEARATLNNSSSSYIDSDPLPHVAAASMTAGAACALITNPLLLVKTKQQTAATVLSYRQAVVQTIHWSAHHSSVTAIRNLYTGLAPHAISEIAGRGVYFVTYEALKRRLAQPRQQQHAHSQQQQGNTLIERMVAAGVAGIVCWSIIFPFDAVRCRMYAAGNAGSATDTAVQMYKSAGWKSFYRGMGVTLLRAGPVAAFVLPIYDVSLERLSKIK